MITIVMTINAVLYKNLKSSKTTHHYIEMLSVSDNRVSKPTPFYNFVIL